MNDKFDLNPMPTPNGTPEEEASKASAIATMRKAIRQGKQNMEIDGPAGKAAMQRLAALVYAERDSHAGKWARHILLGLYNAGGFIEGNKVQLSSVYALPLTWRRELDAVALGVGWGPFRDSDIRESFQKVDGKKAVEWFLSDESAPDTIIADDTDLPSEQDIEKGYMALVDLVEQIAGSDTGQAVHLRGLLASLSGEGPAVHFNCMGLDDDLRRKFLSIFAALHPNALPPERIARTFEDYTGQHGLAWFRDGCK